MSTRTEPRSAAPRYLRRLARSEAVAVLVAAGVAVTVGSALLRSPATVDEVSITNPTDYHIAVEVRGSRGGWMHLSTVPRHGTITVSEVIDQGETWIFRLTAQGRRASEFRTDRRELEAAGWAANIPIVAGTELRDAGATLPP